jgi:alkanesulfonate monooxygenase SsuD/methylene tetrahydromethanopterin reductase-like flavin-dependent oxidoreductase (luciferase family)
LLTIRRADVLSFGIKTSQIGLTYTEILDTWRAADAMPAFSHAWLWDHMITLRGPAETATLEAWTLLAALAAQTSRLRLGVIVTSNRLRSAPLLAKMAATVDIVAAGRLDFGIGAGGSRVAGPNPAIREFEAYGVPLVSPGEAVRDLAESLTVIRRMWTETEPFDFDGPTLTLRGAVCEPKPVQQPHPPIMIGGYGARMLRVVAEHADIWNYPGQPDAEFRRREAILNDHCAAIGRDPATITRSMQTIVRAAEPDAAATTRATLHEMVDAGVRHIVLAAVLDGRPLEWLVEEIVEPVRAAAG